MANIIKVKRSAVPSNVPTTGQLELGEIAINTYDGKMFIKKDTGTQSIVEIGAGGGGGSAPNTELVYGTGSGFGSSSTLTYSTTDGSFNLLPGSFTTPGDLIMESPQGNTSATYGGSIYIGSPDVLGPGAGAAANAGSVSIYAGRARGTGNSGNISITAGDASSTIGAQAGSITLQAGNANLGGLAGNVNIFGGNISLSDVGNGGNVTIQSGNAGNGGNFSGGQLTLRGGVGGGDSQGGTVIIEGGLPQYETGTWFLSRIEMTGASSPGGDNSNINGGSIVIQVGENTGTGFPGVLNLVLPSNSSLQLNGNDGSPGQVLTSNGPLAAPTWEFPGGGNSPTGVWTGTISGYLTGSVAPLVGLSNLVNCDYMTYDGTFGEFTATNNGGSYAMSISLLISAPGPANAGGDVVRITDAGSSWIPLIDQAAAIPGGATAFQFTANQLFVSSNNFIGIPSIDIQTWGVESALDISVTVVVIWQNGAQPV